MTDHDLRSGGGPRADRPKRRTFTADGSAFEALTLLHRSAPLFDLSGRSLEFACRFTDQAIEDARGLAGAGHDPITWMRRAVASGRLSWHPPTGRPPFPGARFYLLTGPYYLPVAWDKDARRPLVALTVRRARVSLLRRVAVWLRRRFALRVA